MALSALKVSGTEAAVPFSARSICGVRLMCADDFGIDDDQWPSAGGNVFAALMEAVQTCSLGQISSTFFEVGGQYRRNV